MGIIFATQSDPQFDKARQSFNEARQQFLRIQDELLAEGNETEELIGKAIDLNLIVYLFNVQDRCLGDECSASICRSAVRPI